MNKNGFALILLLLLVIILVAGFLILNKLNQSPPVANNNSPSLNTTYSIGQKSKVQTDGVLSPLRGGVFFDIVIKSVKAQVLGEATSSKKIPVQIFAYEDANGNGVREPGENSLAFMPVNIYDSPFLITQ